MLRQAPLLLSLLLLVGSAAAADWSLLSLIPKMKFANRTIDLSNYCDSWRFNVEVNNIRGFPLVPPECASLNGAYLTGGQYKSDVSGAIENSILYLNEIVSPKDDGKDAWIFDLDETLLSTVPFYEKHGFGAEILDPSALSAWQKEGKAPVIESALNLYNKIKLKGVAIFIIASRHESLREATINNLVNVGFHSWSGLFLRADDDNGSIGSFKAQQRQVIASQGYRLWAVVSSQWSSLFGDPSPLRIFKLPNPLYYEV